MSKNSDLQYIHVNVNLTLNENDYQWNSPRVEANVSFSIPTSLFSGKLFAELVEKQIATLPAKLELEKLRLKEEEEAKVEAEKVSV